MKSFETFLSEAEASDKDLSNIANKLEKAFSTIKGVDGGEVYFGGRLHMLSLYVSQKNEDFITAEVQDAKDQTPFRGKVFKLKSESDIPKTIKGLVSEVNRYAKDYNRHVVDKDQKIAKDKFLKV